MMDDEVAEDDFDDGMPSWEDIVPAAEENSQQSNASKEVHLSTGCIHQIATDPVCPKDPVVVQVTAVKPMGTGRYRMQISDGSLTMAVMPASQLNHLLADGTIKENTVIRMTSYTLNHVQDAKILILLNLEVVAQLDHRIITNTEADDSASKPAATEPDGMEMLGTLGGLSNMLSNSFASLEAKLVSQQEAISKLQQDVKKIKAHCKIA